MLKRVLAVVATIGLLFTGAASNAATKLVAYSPSAGPFARCDAESNVKGTAKVVQDYLKSINNCITANRVVNSKMPVAKPKTALSSASAYGDLEKCKLPQPSNLSSFRGFPVSADARYAEKRHPGAGSVIQVIGVAAPDTPATNGTPSQEYKYHLDQFKDWLGNVNNSNTPVTVRVADKWYEYGSPLKPLGISHYSYGEASKAFGRKVIEISDADVNYSDVDYVIVVVPAGTPHDVIGQGALGEQTSAEGPIHNMSVVSPATFKKYQQNNFAGFLNITMWIHELYHPGFNMGDQVGDGKWIYHPGAPGPDPAELKAWNFENRGMGEWGMFANGTTDMLQWQKWLLGFTTDSQVACASTNDKTITWLAPGSTKTSKRKILVVPLSATEAIVVESVRATGLNYKLAKHEQGALVYTIDMSTDTYDFGYNVQFPETRAWRSIRHSMDTAPFKKGESFTYKGIKITNVEWGEFGDVIKVEPATSGK
jgi:hypothetical protein